MSHYWLTSRNGGAPQLAVGLMFVWVAMLVASVPAISDDAAKPGDKIIEADEISPKGHPPSLKKAAENPTVYLWQEGDDVWRLRVRTKKQKHEFAGKITVHGGKVVRISDFTKMEAGQKKKGNKNTEDFGRWNDDHTQIDFKFLTQGGEDGFAFKVDAKVESVTFDLKTDNAYHTEQIRIGLKEKNPPSVPFTLSNAKSKPAASKEETTEKPEK